MYSPGHASADTEGQEATGLLAHLGTCQLKFCHCRPAALGSFLLGSLPATLPLAWSTVGACWDTRAAPCLVLLVSPPAGLTPSILPVHIPLQSLSTLQLIDTSTRLGVITNLLLLSQFTTDFVPAFTLVLIFIPPFFSDCCPESCTLFGSCPYCPYSF